MRELKHAWGWRTTSKLVVLSVDDYGAVRLNNRAAREKLPGLRGHMDQLDAVETREDLEALFSVLRSVKGGDGRPAVFTPYALAANPDFAWMRENRSYGYEVLPETFARLSAEQPAAYEGAWALWREGMAEGLFQPQFHGREHLSVPVIEEKLRRKDADLEINLELKSLAGLKSPETMPGVRFTEAFGLHDASLLEGHKEVIKDGVARFREVFGHAPDVFTPPSQILHPDLDVFAGAQGLKALDLPFQSRRPLGGGKSKRSVSFLRRRAGVGRGALSARLALSRRAAFTLNRWAQR